MSTTISERPGVYTDYSVSGVVRASAGGGAVGLAATAGSGDTNKVVAVTDHGAALSAFSDGNLPALVKILLANGASAVYCVRVDEGDEGAPDYAAAFEKLMTVEGVRFMVCDSHDALVHAAMKAAIDGADERSRYRVGVVESGESEVSELTEKAGKLNSERIVLVSHHETEGTPGAVAAAVCGAAAGETDPALPLNGAVLSGLGAIGDNFSDADLTRLVQGGVLPVETSGGAVSILRGITTRTATGDVQDGVWRELNTILILNEVIPGIRDTLRANFSRVKNNARTRGAIRTRVIIELENYVAREIIDSYDSVTAEQSEDDGTVCVVTFGFTVAHGLNIIRLSATITV